MNETHVGRQRPTTTMADDNDFVSWKKRWSMFEYCRFEKSIWFLLVEDQEENESRGKKSKSIHSFHFHIEK